MIARWATAVLLAFAAAPALAEDDVAELARAASVQLAEAAEALAEAEGARDRIAALTQTVRAYEQGLGAMREGLRRAALRERSLRDELAAQDVEITRLLGVLETVEASGRPAALIHPDGVLPALRAGMLAGDVVPALNARAGGLAADLDELRAVIALQEAGQAQFETALEGIRTARLGLSEAVSKRTDLPPRLATDDAAMQALINSAETLSAFADSLVTESPWKGVVSETWPMPVLGHLLRGFGEKDAAGVARPGWVVTTAPEALVVAPSPGTVCFAGDLPDFGAVVLVEPRPGELLVLAGLGEVYVRRNQVVAAGEALGVMAGDAAAQEKLNETGDGSGQLAGETLYMELRQGRDAVDPATRFDPEAQ